MLDVHGEQKTLGDIEQEDRLNQIHRREHSLGESMQEALHKGIREQIYSERATSIKGVLVQIGVVAVAIFLVYITFWWITGEYKNPY